MSSKEEQRAAAKKLLETALAANVKMPTGASALVAAGQSLLANKVDGDYDYDAALKELSEKFGVDEKAKAKAPAAKATKAKKTVKKEEVEDEEEEEEEEEKPKKKVTKKPAAKKVKKEEDEEEEETAKPKKRSRPKKEKKEEEGAEGGGEEEADTPSKKKSKKKEAVCPENAELAACFMEMGGNFFKEGDRMRGAAYMKAYSALMDHDEVITSGKQAKKIKGVGDGTAKKIDEFLETGKIQVLEEVRARKNQVM